MTETKSKPKAKTKKIILRSLCNVKYCNGGPGDVVEAPEDFADRLIERRGAVAFDAKIHNSDGTPKETKT